MADDPATPRPRTEGTPPGAGRPAATTGTPGRLVVAAGLGVATAIAPLALGTGMPGDGRWIIVAWCAGLLAQVAAPGRRGWLALGAGIALTVSAEVATQAISGGLAWLIVAALWAIGSFGSLAGAVGLRILRIGPRAALGDRMVLAGIGLIVAVAVLFVYLAGEFARNPP